MRGVAGATWFLTDGGANDSVAKHVEDPIANAHLHGTQIQQKGQTDGISFPIGASLMRKREMQERRALTTTVITAL